MNFSLILKGDVGEDKRTRSVTVFTSLKSFCSIRQRAVICDLQLEKEGVGESGARRGANRWMGKTYRESVGVGVGVGGLIDSNADT